MRTLRFQLAVWAVLLIVVGAGRAAGQGDSAANAPAQLLTQARALLQARRLDSAAALLRRVTDAPASAERVQAWVLLGVTAFYGEGDSAASAAFHEAFRLDPGLQVDGLERYDPEIARLFAEARPAARAGEPAAAPAAGTGEGEVYDCLTRCPPGVAAPAFTYFPDQQVLDGAALPARRAHSYIALQAVVDANGLVEPESVRLLSSTAVGVEGQIERALPQARFRPGRANGVPVRTRVQLRFDFSAEGTGLINYTYRVLGR